MDATNLIAYLPFDADVTEDYCGNTWEAIGTPTIKGERLTLSNSSCLKLNGSFTLGGQDLTICIRCKDGGAGNGMFAFYGSTLRAYRTSNSSEFVLQVRNSEYKFSGFNYNNERFIAICYTHADSTWRVFADGALKGTATKTLAQYTYSLFFIGAYGSNDQSGGYCWNGTIGDFMIFNGVALWTESFTPPTDDELFNLKMQLAGHVHQYFTAPVVTDIYHVPKGWQHINPGDAELLEVDGTTLRGDYSKSVTGVCFRGGSYSQDCFNTPAGLKEVWIRFDLWTQTHGSGGVSYSIGHRSSSTGGIIGVSRTTTATDTSTFKITGTAGTIYGTPNGISRCLLHIKSHATNGLCELNVNGSTISTTGNINGGNDLDCLVVYANDYAPKCYFSNIIVSESQLTLDSGWHRDIVPAEAQITAPKLNVRLKGADVPIPLRTKRATGSVTIRVGNSNFYCPATSTASLQAAVTFRLDDANHRLINSFG